MSFSTSKLATRIEPLSIGMRPLMQRRTVDLPEPDGPMMHTTSPFGTSNDTPFSTSTAPNDLWMSLTLTIGCSGMGGPSGGMPSLQMLTAYRRSR